MKYLLPDKAYNVLKWISVLLLPVIAWAYGELAPDYGIDPYKVVHALNTIGTAIGLLIGISHLSAVVSARTQADPDDTADLGRHLRGE